MKVINSLKMEEITPKVNDHVTIDSTIISDGSNSYNELKEPMNTIHTWSPQRKAPNSYRGYTRPSATQKDYYCTFIIGSMMIFWRITSTNSASNSTIDISKTCLTE